MGRFPPRLQLSAKDQGRLNSVILSDFLLLVERATCFGMAFDPMDSIEQTFTLRTSSSVKSAYRERVTKDTLFTETNSTNGSGCLGGNLSSYRTATLYLQWETMLSRLFLEIRESPTGGVLSLTQSFRTVREVKSSVHLTPLMLNANLSLNRSFEWTVRNWILSIEMSSESTPSKRSSILPFVKR
jgi:hypothetical protein